MGDVPQFAPLVSVAMITHNHERFITKAIESVLAQRTRFPIEVVIGEDASSDGTRRHIDGLRAQAPEVIRVLTHTSNIGMHRNLESVLRACRGEFIALLEGDDYWTFEDKLQTQVEVLRRRAHVVGTFHPVTIVDSLDRCTGKSYGTKEASEIGTRELLLGNIIPTASVMLRRNALPTLPDRVLKLKMRDWPMWVFASLRGPWLYLPKVMAAYRVHDRGSWVGLSPTAQRDSTIKLFNMFAAELPRPFPAIARQQLTRMRIEALEEALANYRPAKAFRELREIVPLFPYFRIGDSSALWRAVSPRTHWAVKRMLRQVRRFAKKLPWFA